MHLLQTLEHPYALAAAFSRDGARLVTAGMNNDVTVWQTANWSREAHINAHDKSINALGVSLDGSILVTGSSDCTAAIRSLPGLEERHRVRDRKKVVSGLAMSPDTDLFAICSYGGADCGLGFRRATCSRFPGQSRQSDGRGVLGGFHPNFGGWARGRTHHLVVSRRRALGIRAGPRHRPERLEAGWCQRAGVDTWVRRQTQSVGCRWVASGPFRRALGRAHHGMPVGP